MKKQLTLLRHAKSSWQYAVEDRNRPLTVKGIERIKAVSKASAAVFQNFDYVYCSPANRALHTATIMLESLGLPFEKLIVTEQLYTFDPSDVLKFIHSLDDKNHRVICVGHNPAFTDVVNALGDQPCDNLPTAAWSHLQFNQEKWASIKNGVTQYGIPKQMLQNG